MILKYKTPSGMWAYEEADTILCKGVLIYPVAQEYRKGGEKFEEFLIKKMNSKTSDEHEAIELEFLNEAYTAIDKHIKFHCDGLQTDISYRVPCKLFDIDAVDIVVLVREGKHDRCIAFGCEGKTKQEVYILNDSGKTIERIS